MQDLRVFISSTWLDLQPEREALLHTVLGLRGCAFKGMEHFGARAEDTRTMSLQEVEDSELYLGVVGHRWGSGITEAEYRHARALGRPCLLFLRAPVDPASAAETEDARLRAWREELRQAHAVGTFSTPQELATQVALALHNRLFPRSVLDGLAIEHEAQIRDFMDLYLGSAERPAAFGGREAELAALDRWLEDESAPRLMLVAGPAGRGKSALLVHWAQRVPGRTAAHAILFPVSVRFQTNRAHTAYASIGTRLARIHGIRLAASIESTEREWRDITRDLLQRPLPQGTRAVLVIDGADEAADWSLEDGWLPAPPPAGLRILVSARWVAGDADHQGWLQRLGWHGQAKAMDLNPLSPSGVAQVLRGMSEPLAEMSRRADVVAELHRLSEGDPLIVSLYATDLRARGGAAARLEPEQLSAIPPGLKGYFDRWWHEQKQLWGERQPLVQPLVSALLTTLATAFGPLRAHELLELLPPELRGSAVYLLDDSLSTLERFVVGDGAGQGHAFSHPRLADYFFGQLVDKKQAGAADLPFVDWGRRCLADLQAGRRGPEAVPEYLLRFLRLHLQRAGAAAADWQGLAGRDWARAWERFDRGSWVGFRADCEALRAHVVAHDEAEVAQARPPLLLGLHWRTALFECSLGSLAAGMPGEMLTALVREAVWSAAQAVSYAGGIPDPGARLLATVVLATTLPEEEQPLAGAALLRELRAQARTAAGRDRLTDALATLRQRGAAGLPALRAWNAALAPVREGRNEHLPRPDPAELEAVASRQAPTELSERVHLQLPALLARASAERPGPEGQQARALLWRALPWLDAERLLECVPALAPTLTAEEAGELAETIAAVAAPRQRAQLMAAIGVGAPSGVIAQAAAAPVGSGAGRALLQQMASLPAGLPQPLLAAWWHTGADQWAPAGRLMMHLRLARELPQPEARQALVAQALDTCLPRLAPARAAGAGAALLAALRPPGHLSSQRWHWAQDPGVVMARRQVTRLLSLVPAAAGLAREAVQALLGAEIASTLPAQLVQALKHALEVPAAAGGPLPVTTTSMAEPLGLAAEDGAAAWRERVVRLLTRGHAAPGTSDAAELLTAAAALWDVDPDQAWSLLGWAAELELDDTLRAAWLQAGLAAHGRGTVTAARGEWALHAAGIAASLLQAPPGLLGAALQALVHQGGATQPLLEQLLPTDDGGAGLIVPWLLAAQLRDEREARWAVEAWSDASCRPAAAQLAGWARALLDLRAHAVAPLLVDVLAERAGGAGVLALAEPAAALSTAEARCRALLVLVPRAPARQRAGLLLSALKQARQAWDDPWLGLAAVRLCTEFATHEPAVLEAAVETARALPDRPSRAQALVALAPWLGAAALRSAAGTFGRLDDVAQRVLAIWHLAAPWAEHAHAAAHGLREAAARQLAQAAEPHTPEGVAAVLLAAALVPGGQRTALLAQAMPLLGDSAPRWPAELADAIETALPTALADAPVPLLSCALAGLRRWIAQGLQARDPRRTRIERMAFALLPQLPPGLQMRALCAAGDCLLQADVAGWADLLDPSVAAGRVAQPARLSAALRQRLAAARRALADDAGGRWLPADAAPTDPMPAAEPQRADWISRRSLLAASGPGDLAMLVAAAESMLETQARQQAATYLAVWSGPSTLEPALRLVMGIESPADRAVAAQRLALRGSAPWRERCLRLADAALRAEADAASCLRAALDIVAHDPGTQPMVLAVVERLPEPLLVEQGLIALAAVSARDGGRRSGGSTRLGSIVQAIGRRTDPVARARLLVRTGPLLDAAGAALALELVAALPTERLRACALPPCLRGMADAEQARCRGLVDAVLQPDAWLALQLGLVQRWPGLSGTDAERAEQCFAALPPEEALRGLLGLAPHWPAAAQAGYGRAAAALGSPRLVARALFAALAQAGPWAAADVNEAWLDCARGWADPLPRVLLLGLAGARDRVEAWIAEAVSAARLLPEALQVRAWRQVVRASGRMPPLLMDELVRIAHTHPLAAAWAWSACAAWLDGDQARTGWRTLQAQQPLLPPGELRRFERSMRAALLHRDGDLSAAARRLAGPVPKAPPLDASLQRRIATLVTQAMAGLPAQPAAASAALAVRAIDISATALLQRLHRLPTRGDRLALVGGLLHAGTVSARTVAELLPWLPGLVGAEALPELLPGCARQLPAGERLRLWRLLHRADDPALLLRLCRVTAATCADADRQQLHRVVGELLHDAGQGLRDQVLPRLGALAPLLLHLAGPRSNIDAIEAVADAGALWP